jgi:hypothetical protein
MYIGHNRGRIHYFGFRISDRIGTLKFRPRSLIKERRPFRSEKESYYTTEKTFTGEVVILLFTSLLTDRAKDVFHTIITGKVLDNRLRNLWNLGSIGNR